MNCTRKQTETQITIAKWQMPSYITNPEVTAVQNTKNPIQRKAAGLDRHFAKSRNFGK